MDFTAFIKKIGKRISNDSSKNGRRFPRRINDSCVANIEGQLHPVKDWSLGGVLITADERLYSPGQSLEIGLKFKIDDELMEIVHNGRVVRKLSGKIAIEFAPMDRVARHRFMHIFDLCASKDVA